MTCVSPFNSLLHKFASQHATRLPPWLVCTAGPDTVRRVQAEYDKVKGMQWSSIVGDVAHLAAMLTLMGALSSQLVEPLLPAANRLLAQPLDAPVLLSVAALVLDLVVPVFAIWLALFAAFFHSWLSAVAEVTRFADRRFYHDWWNAHTLGEFWARWNVPVHNWCLVTVRAPLEHFGAPPRRETACAHCTAPTCAPCTGSLLLHACLRPWVLPTKLTRRASMQACRGSCPT